MSDHFQATGSGGVGIMKVMVSNNADRHPARMWAETTADQLVELDPRATDPERIRKAIALRHWIIEVLEPLFGQPSRPHTGRVMALMRQASKGTPWEEAISLLNDEMRLVVERNLNTIYPEI